MILVSIFSKVTDFLGKLTAVEARSLYLDPHADCMNAIENVTLSTLAKPA